MREEDLSEENASPLEDSESAASGGHGADRKAAELNDLHGAVPPSEAGAALHEYVSEPKDQPSRRLKWGPWTRWRSYREHQRQALAFWRGRDPEENERGRIPEDEGVQVPGVWVAELYTPSTIDGLLNGIHALGWEYGRARDASLTKWMSNVREGRQAGWINLGLVSPAVAGHFMRERTASLPSGVAAALPILLSLTPSLTALVIVFILDEDAATSLQAPLRADFKTAVRATARSGFWDSARYALGLSSTLFGLTIVPPDILRREAVRKRVHDIENACAQWVNQKLPGAFCSLRRVRNPTAVLFVTEQARPLSGEAHNLRAFGGLAIDRDYDAWESDQWAGTRLVLPRGWDKEGCRLTFACRRRDAVPKLPYYSYPESNWTIAQRAHDFVPGLLSRWAINCLLDGYHEVLSTRRDQVARDGRYRTVRDLKDLRALARTTLYDIGACTEEIIEFSKKEVGYGWNVLEMSHAREAGAGKASLLRALRSSQRNRAKQIQREASLLQSTLSTSNEVSQAISMARIQRILVLLTLISVGVALYVGVLR